jgi:hypothetical protein
MVFRNAPPRVFTPRIHGMAIIAGGREREKNSGRMSGGIATANNRS